MGLGMMSLGTVTVLNSIFPITYSDAVLGLSGLLDKSSAVGDSQDLHRECRERLLGVVPAIVC